MFIRGKDRGPEKGSNSRRVAAHRKRTWVFSAIKVTKPFPFRDQNSRDPLTWFWNFHVFVVMNVIMGNVRICIKELDTGKPTEAMGIRLFMFKRGPKNSK